MVELQREYVFGPAGQYIADIIEKRKQAEAEAGAEPEIIEMMIKLGKTGVTEAELAKLALAKAEIAKAQEAK